MKKQQAVFLYYDSEVKQISGWGRWKDTLSFGLNDAKMKAFLKRGLPKGSWLVVKSSLDEAEQYFEKIEGTISKINS
tara:strand:+ start:249 stop:479 length:231 start_codon:yes stop_codon:yes gene_type:complete